ncbi:zinc-binding alcohol dehydrogenase family protein [Secundilactobacillus folii]|uniref:Zinc-type alcohol dehydrogenase-like protein n=1 Tax=Secundilactobacillus folii TaxID=2678357 RepID=A0A7X2XXC8_9LACO|nr:zinc-binding alcohol dehydrogenase family protein [Secundilactobacillus folii]MTV82855.1 zinc-binding alcohol dehydrogenase family protein [Secundilactobacillus folii]
MTTMKAIGVNANHQLTDLTLPKPSASSNQVLVQVGAVSVNPVDTKLKETVTPKMAPKILGYDAVGTVVETGEEVTKFRVGDQIYYAGSTQMAGANEEYQLVDERLASLAPRSLTEAEIAAMPLTSLTAYELLFEKMQFVGKANQNQRRTLLIINGAGGVGSIMAQLAHWAGLTVLATSSPKNFDWLKHNQVDYPLDYHEDLLVQVRDLGYDGLDAVAILYAPEDYFDVAAELIRPFGHIGSIVGSSADLPLYKIKNKAASFDWEYMFTKSDADYNVNSQGKTLQLIARLLDQGVLTPTLTQALTGGINAASLKQAYDLVSRGQVHGKLVLTGGFNAPVTD